MADKKTKQVFKPVYKDLVLRCSCVPENVGENKKGVINK
jgi:hypothetical protein